MKEKPAPTAEELQKAIRAHCLECSGNWRAVHSCSITKCRLWPYRKSRTKAKESNIRGQMTVFDLIGKE